MVRMSSFVRGGFCPNCNGLLYLLSRDDETQPWQHSGAPVREDREGNHMRCPVCSYRVALKRSDVTPGWSYEIDFPPRAGKS